VGWLKLPFDDSRSEILCPCRATLGKSLFWRKWVSPNEPKFDKRHLKSKYFGLLMAGEARVCEARACEAKSCEARACEAEAYDETA
jgi:hypothetical protein